MKTAPFFKAIFISLCITLFISEQLRAQTNSINTSIEFKNLRDKGILANKNGNYLEALEYYTKAEILADKNQWIEKSVDSKINLGIVYSNLSNNGESLGYYLRALEMAEKFNLNDIIAITLTNIGVLYSSEKDYEKALEYFKKAYPLTKGKPLEYIRISVAINFSDVYNALGDFKKARKYLNDVESITKSKNGYLQYWKVNYAETLMLEGRLSEAQNMMEKLIREVDPKDPNKCYVYMLELLSRIYTRQNNISHAIMFANKGLQNTVEIGIKLKFYNALSELYFKKREYIIAKQYKDSVIETKDSISILINRGLYESNKVKLKIQDYQNQLQVNQQKQEKQQFLFVGVIIFSLLLFLFLFLFVYRGLKNKIIKQKQKQIIAENEKKIFDLEILGLKNDIAEKNRRLSTKALYLSGRNELIEEVINSLSHIPEVSQKKEISDYIKTLRNYLKTDAEWDEFISYFQQVNPEFLKTLQIKHPQLTAPDIRFLCYIYMNLDIREIGSIFNITYNAAVKRQYRIKEKMGLDKDIHLFEYLLQL